MTVLGLTAFSVRNAADFEIADLSVGQLLKSGKDNGFPEVPHSVLDDSAWKVIAARRWRKPGKIGILEGEAIAWNLRRLVRNQSSFGKRHLVLSDNMSGVCAITKGRSSNNGVL